MENDAFPFVNTRRKVLRWHWQRQVLRTCIVCVGVQSWASWNRWVNMTTTYWTLNVNYLASESWQDEGGIISSLRTGRESSPSGRTNNPVIWRTRLQTDQLKAPGPLGYSADSLVEFDCFIIQSWVFTRLLQCKSSQEVAGSTPYGAINNVETH